MNVAPSSTAIEPAAPLVVAEAGDTPPEIDASCRAPLLFLFTSAGVWLVLATLLGLLSSIQLVAPQFLSGCPYLTFGRLRPAAENALLYGFASQAAYGVIIWMLCRLGRVSLCCQYPYVIAGGFWNLGVTVGVLSIFAGFSTGFKWLEFPRFAAPILFIAQIVLGGAILFTFHSRRQRELYVSQWYLVGAVFWFTWIYSAGNLLLGCFPVRGVLQGVVDAWYKNNFLLLWLGSVGLACVYYFVPKLLGRPLYSRGLAVFSFWSYAFVANWTGLNQMTGGPIPAWMVSASIGANFLLLIPLVVIACNWHYTISCDLDAIKRSRVLSYAALGGGFFLLSSLLGILFSFRRVSAAIQFTHVWGAYQTLFVYGFFGLSIFAAIYYVVPRLVNLEWPCEHLSKLHFRATVAGIGVAGIGLLVAGIVQGAGINDSSKQFHDVIGSTKPWLILAAIGAALIAAGQAAFLWNLIKVLRSHTEPFRRTSLSFLSGVDTQNAGVTR